MRVTISMILRQSFPIARAGGHDSRSSVEGNRPLTHDHENQDALSARSSQTPLTLSSDDAGVPAMPIDETVCRGSRRRRYEPAAPLTQPRICLPRRCIHVCVCTCMRLRSTHSCVANISPHVCVNISTPLRYRKAEGEPSGDHRIRSD